MRIHSLILGETYFENGIPGGGVAWDTRKLFDKAFQLLGHRPDSRFLRNFMALLRPQGFIARDLIPGCWCYWSGMDHEDTNLIYGLFPWWIRTEGAVGGEA